MAWEEVWLSARASAARNRTLVRTRSRLAPRENPLSPVMARPHLRSWYGDAVRVSAGTPMLLTTASAAGKCGRAPSRAAPGPAGSVDRPPTRWDDDESASRRH